MRVDNTVYFAPGIEYKQMDWSDPEALISPFRMRVWGFYLKPARYFVDLWNRLSRRLNADKSKLSGLAFGCGVISSTAIDFLAGIEYFPSKDVGDRYKKWLNNRLSLFYIPDPQNQNHLVSARFYYEFRNGLVHEGRIKNAGQFSFDPDLFTTNSLFEIIGDALVVNPANLLDSIANALDNYLSEISSDTPRLNKFGNTLNAYFSDDINYVKMHG